MGFHSNRLLITGISGFTGKHLAAYFEQNGYDVYGITRKASANPKWLQCDLSNIVDIKNIIEKICPDFIIHLAGISFTGEKNASLIYDMNVIATCNLLDAVLSLDINLQKIILSSSAIVYGNQHQEILREDMCPRPSNHYGCSKLSMELLAQTYTGKLPIMIARPFNYTGPGQENHFLIPKIIAHYKDKKASIELGNLDIEREFNDIRDICEMYGLLLKSGVENSIVNLCTGRGISLLHVLETMNNIAGYRIKVNVNPEFVRPNEIRRLIGSTQHLESLIGPVKALDHEETLRYMYFH